MEQMILEYSGAFSQSLCENIIGEMLQDPDRENCSEVVHIPSYTEDTFYLDNPVLAAESYSIIQNCLSDYICRTDMQVPATGFRLRDISPVENRKGLPSHTDPSILMSKGERLFRPLICITFLNSDYLGGELVFPKHDVIIKPETGKLLIFPAHFTYPHIALTATNPRYILKTDLVLDEKYWVLL